MTNKFTPEESKSILQKMGISINSQDLIFYSQECGLTEVEHLINAGIDVNSGHDDYFPLIQSAKKGHSEIVKILLKNGANINIVDTSKCDSLYYSVLEEHFEVSKLLLESGANPNGVEGGEHSPIINAIRNENKKLIQLLADYNADLNIKSTDGYSLAYSCYHHCSKETYDYLISLGATPLSDEETKKTSLFKKIKVRIISAYTKAYLFWAVNLFSFIIIFFVLNEKTGGSFLSRVYVFLLCTIIGGLIGMGFSSHDETAKVKGFRRGAGTLLIFLTLIQWSTNDYTPSHSSSYSSSEGHSCGECGSSFPGNGWSTSGGEQFQQSSWTGYGYCSKSCAYDSQPSRWK